MMKDITNTVNVDHDRLIEAIANLALHNRILP